MNATADIRLYQAHAKINLSLEIVGRRPDGYHDLVSVMQEVSLFDSLSFEPATELEFSCSDPDLVGGNLVTQAARLLAHRFGVTQGCCIQLHKRIPAGAGLGGGSSDAAATLVALNRLWDLQLPPSDLSVLAAEIGSDVPFFLTGGTAEVAGRGEYVCPLPSLPETWYVLVNPGVHVSTRDVFAELRPAEWSAGNATRALAEEIRDIRPARLSVNGLSSALFRLYPAAEECFRRVSDQSQGRVMVSGSGPTVVAQVESRRDGDRLASLLPESYWTAVVHNVARGVGDST